MVIIHRISAMAPRSMWDFFVYNEDAMLKYPKLGPRPAFMQPQAVPHGGIGFYIWGNNGK